MPIDTDFHTHVSRSSARKMAQSAQEKGLRVVGLSEHDFQMKEARSTLDHLPLEGLLLTFPTYIEEVRTAHQDLRLEVRLGMDVGGSGSLHQLQNFLPASADTQRFPPV